MSKVNSSDVINTAIQHISSAVVEKINALIQVLVSSFGSITMPSTSPGNMFETQANSVASFSVNTTPSVGTDIPCRSRPTNLSSPCSSSRPTLLRTCSEAILVNLYYFFSRFLVILLAFFVRGQKFCFFSDFY